METRRVSKRLPTFTNSEDYRAAISGAMTDEAAQYQDNGFVACVRNWISENGRNVARACATGMGAVLLTTMMYGSVLSTPQNVDPNPDADVLAVLGVGQRNPSVDYDNLPEADLPDVDGLSTASSPPIVVGEKDYVLVRSVGARSPIIFVEQDDGSFEVMPNVRRPNPNDIRFVEQDDGSLRTVKRSDMSENEWLAAEMADANSEYNRVTRAFGPGAYEEALCALSGMNCDWQQKHIAAVDQKRQLELENELVDTAAMLP